MKGHEASNIKIDMCGRRGNEDCLFFFSVSEGQRIVSYMIARRSNRRLSLLQPQLLFNCVFDGAVVLLLRSRRSPGLGSLGFQDAPKDSTKKELRKWLARWNGSVKKGPGFHGVQQSYRKKGEEQGKGSGRLRCGGNAWGKTTDTRRRLPILLTLIHMTKWRVRFSYYYMEDIWLRETIHCAKSGILSLFYSAKTSFRRTKRAIFPFILA